MQARYKLKITPAAASDLDAIDTYISEELHAPTAAQKLIEKFESNFNSLCDMPYRCELSRNEILKAKGYRKLLIDNYVTLYLINETLKMIIIARVFYGAMDYEKYL
ncbi:MAG: type II toxin-antitoxin system RelE/ParE family toxin [Coriobacteriia bacterium]|nr:type II toxin-antitoxin system RelE/ParE family toxin [Coriobacteriia bacterium]